jgi:hypothetical protein
VNLAPIALFVHSRLEHTRRTVDALRADPLAIASDLVVFADAAKTPEQAAAVTAVRDYVRGIRGFSCVTVVERERNLGLAGSITDGIGRMCDAHGLVIAVEDDLIVAPGFLAFLNDGLQRYADDERVFQISGYMYPGRYGGDDAFFLPMISCWGWATWKRAWALYDPAMSGYARLAADRDLRRRFDLDGAYDYFAMATQQQRGLLDSWGIRWHLSVFLRDGLVLYPPVSLVRNAGIDGSGTHGAGHARLQEEFKFGEGGPAALRLPDRIVVDDDNLRRVEALLRSMKPGLLRRCLTWLAD